MRLRRRASGAHGRSIDPRAERSRASAKQSQEDPSSSRARGAWAQDPSDSVAHVYSLPVSTSIGGIEDTIPAGPPATSRDRSARGDRAVLIIANTGSTARAP